jgi:hypothetical protein
MWTFKNVYAHIHMSPNNCNICCTHKIVFVFHQHKYIVFAGDLVTAVQELSRGKVSEDTCTLLSRLGRTLPPGDQSAKLFALNYDAEKCNSDHLLDMPGIIP